MFNSVAKYFWGGVDESEVLETPEQDNHRVQETLADCEEDDWVLVDNTDKENCSQAACSHQQRNHPYQQYSSINQPRPYLPHDHTSSNGQGSNNDIDQLDDAASLAHHLCVLSNSNKSSRVSSPECRIPNLELDGLDFSDLDENGIDSGFRPSSPESVFSACSGRSHATYRPKGHVSEAWVVAPPPCFTGSQLDESEPLTSSPLENLLIEHPSMSVYDSVPSSALPSSHHFFCLNAITDVSAVGTEEIGMAEGQDETSESPSNDERTALQIQLRQHPNQAVPHSIQFSHKKLVEKFHNDQRYAVIQKKHTLSKQKCHHVNQVQLYNSSSKKNNRRNKRMHPSGCKASRNCQRLH